MVNTTLFIFLIALLAIEGNVLYKKTIVAKPGESAIFNFTTQHGNPILATQFGLKGKGENIKKIFLVVTQSHGIECGYDFNSSEGWRYKNRVFFVGNITTGHAWFKITNVDENDTNTYQVNIRETTHSKYKTYSVVLLVKRNETSSPTISSVNTKQATEGFRTNDPTGIWNSNVTEVPSNETSVKLYPKPSEVNRDPPYGWLIAANVLSFLYALYTLYVKTCTNCTQSRRSRNSDQHEHEQLSRLTL